MRKFSLYRRKAIPDASLMVEAIPIENILAVKLALLQGARTMGAAPPYQLGGCSDDELIRRVAEGESEVLSYIYDRHAPSLYRLLLALLGSAADAEDALQDVFVKLSTGRVRHVRDLRSYLLVAARNEAFTFLRRRKREVCTEVEDLSSSNKTNREFTYELNVDLGYWQELLARLPVEQREVIVLKIWEQMTFNEIAPIVRVSPNTVMSRYRYGIERLRAWCREEDTHEL